MNASISRRQLMRIMSTAGLGAALARRAVGDEKAAGAAAPVVPEGKLVTAPPRPTHPAVWAHGRVMQPACELPVLHEADVLVVGAGPAGFAAAVAAARAGAKTVLAERYGYFGGQWTGGMVLLVISTHATEGGAKIKVMRGLGDELLERLTKIDGAVVNQAPGRHNPTSDPEATKYMMDEMVREAGVKVFLHSWASDVVMDGGAVRGAVFESKSGRQAILARVVVDATGDGDLFAAAGAAHEQRLHAIGLVHRIGNTDRADKARLKQAGFGNLGGVTPLPSVTWVNLRGPSTDCLDVNELTRLELAHRRGIWERVQKMRKAPGGEALYLLQTAPQLGVRISRLLAGTKQLTYAEMKEGKTFPDTIGVGGAQNAQHRGWPIPYGVMVPRKLDGLLATGRCICVDEKLIEDMQLIAACLITGHAAGAAAALASKHGLKPRDVPIADLQKLLRAQGAYLG